MTLQVFEVYRFEDVTGVSGTGTVMEGIVLSDGSALTAWVNSPVKTCTYWPGGLDEIKRIHGHDGKSVVLLHDT